MILNILKFHSVFIAKNECLEHFIAEWNQCFSRISLYRFYWAYRFRRRLLRSLKEFSGVLRNVKEF